MKKTSILLGVLITMLLVAIVVAGAAMTSSTQVSLQEAAKTELVQKTTQIFILDNDAKGDEQDEAGNEPADMPIEGNDLKRAEAAALRHIGDGRVTDSELGDEEGFYEIEITLDNGNQIDVHLDRDFNIIGQKSDDADDNERRYR